MKFLKVGFTRGCHVSGAGGFYFLNAPETLFFEDFIKVCDDFIEKPQALNTLVI